MAKVICECGRPVLVVVKTGRKRSNKARRGVPVSIKGHDLCNRCWTALRRKMRKEKR